MKNATKSQPRITRLLPAIEAHDLWAESYDNGDNPLLALEERVITPMLPHVVGKNVLDLGCGTGRWLSHLSRHCPARALGVDPSVAMLKFAKSKPRLAGSLIRGDFLALPVADSSIDLTICSFAVGYCSDLSVLAGELARVSKPEARFLLSDFHPESLRLGWKRSFHYRNEVIEIVNYPHSIANIRNAFEEAGFAQVLGAEHCFGEQERDLFSRAGKLAVFDSGRDVPAIFTLTFQFLDGLAIGTD